LKLASREPNDFIASNCFMAAENVKIFHVLQAGMIYNAELLCEEVETIFTGCIDITRKKLKIVYNFLSTYFQVLRYNMRHCVLC
jgi:hypothetical protein